MIEQLKKQLLRDEGSVPHAYIDSEGFLTIGVGRLIDPKKGGGLRPDEIDYLLANDIADRVAALSKALPWVSGLSDARKGALCNAAFQLGVNGLLAFTDTLTHLRAGRYEEASAAMLKSRWAQQTPARVQRLALQIKTDVWQ